jgi:hypothetical protein
LTRKGFDAAMSWASPYYTRIQFSLIFLIKFPYSFAFSSSTWLSLPFISLFV